MNMQLVGKVSRAFRFAIEPIVFSTTKAFFQDFCRECEGAASGTGARTVAALKIPFAAVSIFS